MTYSVYMHTSPDGKVYIGATSKRPARRWDNGNGYHTESFSRDIQKFGWNNFKHEIVAENLSEKEAYELEIELIAKYQSTNPEKGYNISTGGKGAKGVVESSETKEKRLSALRKAMQSDAYHKKLSEAHKGHFVSEETRAKLSEKMKNMSEEHRQKLRKHAKNRTAEHRQKLGKAHSKKVLCVEKNVVFNSLKEASKFSGAFASNISKACKNKKKTAGGYHWEYAEKETRQ